MSQGTESASQADWSKRATSPGPTQGLEAEVTSPPEVVKDSLPERYGMPLLELLVVDTEYIFISWELTDYQLAQARESLGIEAYERRQLVLRVIDANNGATAGEHELHGDVGRWFIRHGLPGHLITAKLAFNAGSKSFPLNTAGPVSLPRDFVIEPHQYEELQAEYDLGHTGELVLVKARLNLEPTWPDKMPPAVTLSVPLPPGSQMIRDSARHTAPTTRRMPSRHEAGSSGEKGDAR